MIKRVPEGFKLFPHREPTISIFRVSRAICTVHCDFGRGNAEALNDLNNNYQFKNIQETWKTYSYPPNLKRNIQETWKTYSYPPNLKRNIQFYLYISMWTQSYVFIKGSFMFIFTYFCGLNRLCASFPREVQGYSQSNASCYCRSKFGGYTAIS